MKLIQKENNKLKFFNITIFKIKNKSNCRKYYLFGIPFYKKKNLFFDIHKSFSKNKSFDCKKFDNQIATVIDKLYINEIFKKNTIDKNRIAFFASEFYDMGGHTECVKSLTELLSDKYEIATFVTNINDCYRLAPKKMSIIEKFSKIDGVNQREENGPEENLEILFNKINEYSPKVLFVFMHMDDYLGCSLLYLLSKYTDIKIIYNNHGSHYPALGMTFAHAISFQLPAAQWVTQNYRKIDKGVNLNLSDQKEEDIRHISTFDCEKIRKKLGILEGNFFTLSGASSYKFFDGNDSSYFKMIKRILEKEPKLQHVVITNLKNNQKRIIDKIFKNEKEKQRLKIIGFTPEFSSIFQSCDLFIDSLPVGSALTHVELMKHKKVSIVNVNKQNSLFSFHEFFPKNYKYMFDNTQEMETAIIELLHNKEERKKQSEFLYNHYINTFEGNFVRKQHINVIENAENIENLYIHINDEIDYKVNL